VWTYAAEDAARDDGAGSQGIGSLHGACTAGGILGLSSVPRQQGDPMLPYKSANRTRGVQLSVWFMGHRLERDFLLEKGA